jgi:phosphoribosylanthranilate isomerase
MSTRKDITIKVCGLRRTAQAFALADMGVGMLGFNFHEPSPRYAMDHLDVAAMRALAEHPKAPLRVGVFVNATEVHVRQVAERFALNAVQLHGQETPDQCSALSQHFVVIKAFTVRPHFRGIHTEAYSGACAFYLFDAPGAHPGGNGRVFPWSFLSRYTGATPFLLAGGLGPEHAGALVRATYPQLAGVDINSRFELTPGEKDLAPIEQFMERIHYPVVHA